MSPWLLAGVLGVSLPVIAHILNKNKYQETDWAAMQFLNRAIRVRSRQIKIQDFLLLLIRSLAIILLVLAFTGPFMKQSDGIASNFGESRSGVVIAIDASYSMLHSVEGKSRFDKALEKVDEIAKNIHPGDPVSLVLLGEGHRVIMRNMAFNESNFLSTLHEQKAMSTSLNVESIPKSLKELCKNMEANQKEVYILTDLQAGDWKASSTWLRKSFQELSDVASVFVIPVQGDSDNLSVTNLELVSGVLRKGSTARYRATVKNNGKSPVQNIAIKCLLNDIMVDTKSIPKIAPGASETVSFFVPFNNAGPAQISAVLNDDALSIDNTRRTVAMIRNTVAVLVVDGSSDGVVNSGKYLLDALRAQGGGVDSKAMKLTRVSWMTLPSQDLSKYDVVIMSDVPEITAQQAERLKKFVLSGNGLIWFGGDNTKPAVWNKRSGTPPLLPAILEGVINVGDESGAGTALDTVLADHPVCRPLKSLPEDLLSESRFKKVFKLKVDPGSTAVLSLAGSKTPLLIEHTLGRGSVFMFSGPVMPKWNNMAITPAFPMLIQQIITYLTGREFEKDKIVGDSLSLTYVEQPDSSNAVFDTPSGESIKVPVQEHRQQYVALLEEALEPGFYTAKVSVQSPGIPMAVNVANRESNVKSLTATEATDSFAETGVTVTHTEDELMSAISAARTVDSFARFFLLAGLLLLVIESFFADRLLRRNSKTQSVQPEGV
jgi:hypothetical protein